LREGVGACGRRPNDFAACGSELVSERGVVGGPRRRVRAVAQINLRADWVKKRTRPLGSWKNLTALTGFLSTRPLARATLKTRRRKESSRFTVAGSTSARRRVAHA